MSGTATSGPAPGDAPTLYPCAVCGRAHALPPAAAALAVLPEVFAALDRAPPAGPHVVGLLLTGAPGAPARRWCALSGLLTPPPLPATVVPPLWDRDATRDQEQRTLTALDGVTQALGALAPRQAAVLATLAGLSRARERRPLEAERDALEAQRLSWVRERRRLSAELTAAIHQTLEVALPGGTRRALGAVYEAVRGTPMPTGTGECAAPRLLHAANAAGQPVRALAELWWEPPSQRGPRHGALVPPCDERCRPILGALLCPG